MKDIKGFILAAGLGTRLKPWTLHHPKALVPVGGIPMLQRVIHNMIDADITDIVINIHHFGDQIINFISENKSFGINIRFSNESNLLLDTGGAILKAAPLLHDSTVIIHNVDIYTDISIKDLIIYHLDSNTDATLLTSTRYSSRQLLFDSNNMLQGWTNHNTQETIPPAIPEIDKYRQMSFNGIHIINPSVLKWLEEHNTVGPFPIIPQYIAMSKDLKIEAYTPKYDYRWIDIGKQQSLQQAQDMTRKIAH